MTIRSTLRHAAAIGLAAVGVAGAAARADATIYQWVRFAPHNMVYLRWISTTTTDSCPVATVDGSPVTLTRRFAPTARTWGLGR